MNLATSTKGERLVSLDFLRGLIMVLLALESTGLYERLTAVNHNEFIGKFLEQFFHHPWNGLRFWDLIQPGFMFIAGTAMAFSLHKQKAAGLSWSYSFKKILKRCGWLFFWGVLDYAVRPGGLSFELWDVLTQLSFTTLVAFLIFHWQLKYQISFAILLLLLTEFLYRFTGITGFDQPFTDQHNFGNYIDLVLMNKINNDGWVAINCIPTAVHTIAGAMAGKLLIEIKEKSLKVLTITAILCLMAGYSADLLQVTPIIKRIATSSFTLASLGWCLLGLSASFFFIDIKNNRRHLDFFLVMGMNSIFIYLFFEIVGHRWFNEYIDAIIVNLCKMAGIASSQSLILSSLSIFALEWSLCYFLYKKKIFFKL